MNNSPKLAILQSLDSMDQVQMEKVLDYIKGMIHPASSDYRNFKKEAMKEIRKALRKSKTEAGNLLFA
jgi:hypothetical protein